MQTSFRVRLPLINGRSPGGQAAGNLVGSGAPAAWSHCDWRFELGVVLPDGTTLDSELGALDSITLEGFETRGGATAVLSRTVASADINRACTAAAWTAGTDQHAVVVFSNLETAFSFAQGKLSKDLWVVIYGLTTDAPAHRIPLWAGTMSVFLLGAPAGATVIANGNLVAVDGMYDQNGSYGVSGLIPGQLYEWVKGEADASLVCGGTTLTASGMFQAVAGGEATLTGVTLGGDPVSAVVRSAGVFTAAQSDARYQRVAGNAYDYIEIRDELDNSKVIRLRNVGGVPKFDGYE